MRLGRAQSLENILTRCVQKLASILSPVRLIFNAPRGDFRYLHIFYYFILANKGFWAQLLGVGDFYYEIAVQVIELCIQTRSINGGLMDMNDILERLRKKRGAQARLVSVYACNQR
jgi:hypothetical protein